MLYQLSYASVTYSVASAPEYPAAPLSAWSGRRESNPQPTAWKAVTLPLSYSRLGRKPGRLNRHIHSTEPSASRSIHYAKMSGRVGCHLFFLFAEHPYFAVLVVHVHREIVQVIDQLFQILRLELAQVDLHAVFPQGAVHVYARLGRNQAG